MNFSANSNGRNIEAIGSMCQYQLIFYSVCKTYNLNYYFQDFKNIAGKVPPELKQDIWDKNLNNFFNFNNSNNLKSSSKIYDFDFIEDYFTKNTIFKRKIQRQILFYLFRKNIKSIFNKKIISKLNQHISYDDKIFFSKNNSIKISIHLRSPFPEIDIIFSENREVFYGLHRQVDYLNTILRQLEHKFKDKNFEVHIFSKKHFSELLEIKFLNKENIVKIHSDEKLEITLYHLIFSDLLIGSNSGLSYIAHYLSSGRSIFKQSYKNTNRPFYPNCIETNELGYIQNLNNLEI